MTHSDHTVWSLKNKLRYAHRFLTRTWYRAIIHSGLKRTQYVTIRSNNHNLRSYKAMVHNKHTLQIHVRMITGKHHNFVLCEDSQENDTMIRRFPHVCENKTTINIKYAPQMHTGTRDREQIKHHAHPGICTIFARDACTRMNTCTCMNTYMHISRNTRKPALSAHVHDRTQNHDALRAHWHVQRYLQSRTPSAPSTPANLSPPPYLVSIGCTTTQVMQAALKPAHIWKQIRMHCPKS